jgi:hypothetical protein
VVGGAPRRADLGRELGVLEPGAGVEVPPPETTADV